MSAIRGPGVPSAIDLAGVSLSYQRRRDRVDALREVSATVPAGKVIALTGPSGAGKSSLLYIIAGLLRPTGGTVTVNGIDVGALSETASAAFRRNQIGMVFQFFHLLPALTALDNVALPLQLAGVARPAAREAGAKLLDDLGLTERASHRPRELSGGEQQRVAVARAIVGNPPIILADEPTGNLDAESAAIVAELLIREAVAGRTLLVATHDDRLVGHASATIHLDHGRSRVEGLPINAVG